MFPRRLNSKLAYLLLFFSSQTAYFINNQSHFCLINGTSASTDSMSASVEEIVIGKQFTTEVLTIREDVINVGLVA
jgi:hypothetical protein